MQRDRGQLDIEIEEAAAVDLVNPPSDEIRSLAVDLHGGTVPDTSVRLLATSERVDRALEDWTVATRAADLVDGTLRIRTDDTLASSTVVATDDAVRAYVFGEAVGTSESGTHERIRDQIDDRWTDGEAYTIRTPGLATVERTLAEKLGADTRDDFLAFCEAVGPVTSGDVLDERVLLVLAGARNEEQNYEIGQWADYHGFSSRSMINRVKTEMTDAGVIDIEKESGHVGRPRQVLTLPPDLADRSRDELLDEVRSALAD